MTSSIPAGGSRRHIPQSAFGILSSVIGTIAIFVVVARSLGPVDFGVFAYSYAAVSFTGILFDFGYMTRLLRETKLHVGGRAALSVVSLALKACLFAVLTILLLGIMAISGRDLMLIAVLWCGVATISMANLFSTMLRGLAHHWADALNNFAANLSGAIFAGILYLIDAPILGFAAVFPLIGLIYIVGTLRVWRRNCYIEVQKVTKKRLLVEVQNNISYLLDAIAQRSFGFLDIVMLSAVANPLAVGLYQAGQKIAQGANIFSQPFNNVFLPRLSIHAHDGNRFAHVSRKSFMLQAACGVAAFAGLTIIGPYIITLLYSSSFSQARGLMWAFGLLVCVRYISAALTIQLTALGQQKMRTQINLCCVLVLVTSGLVLGYYFGALGMILAATLASLLIGVSSFVVRQRTLTAMRRNISST